MLPPGVRSCQKSNTARTRGLIIGRRIRICHFADVNGRGRAFDLPEGCRGSSSCSLPSATFSFHPAPAAPPLPPIAPPRHYPSGLGTLSTAIWLFDQWADCFGRTTHRE